MKEKWKELILKTEFDKWPLLESLLYENELYSFEVLDPRLEEIDKREKRWDFIDDNIFKNYFQGITVKLYLPEKESSLISARLEKSIQENDLGLIEYNLIDDEDWKNNWKSFYHIQEIGPKIVIKPSWENYDNKEGKIVIELDPQMAFGTGGHETTRMCLLHLQKYLKKDDYLLDIGCGSGILSIAGKLLGASKVLGCDLDSKAVQISRENAKLNEADVDFRTSNLFSNVDIQADLVVGNIIAEIIVDLIEDLRKHLKSGGIFICSGIIQENSRLVENSLISNNFQILEIMTENDWVSIVARDKNA